MPAISFEALPRECRIQIVAFLRPSELFGSYAFVSVQCRIDSNFPSLPQKQWGEVHSGSQITHLLHRLSLESYQKAFQSPRTHLKFLGHVDLLRPDISWEELESLSERAALTDVNSLDLSVQQTRVENDKNITSEQRMKIHEEPMYFYPRALAWALARVFPNLSSLDMSNLSGGPREEGDLFSDLSIFNNDTCPNLSSVTWNNRIGGCRFLRGNDLRTLTNLKELYLDGMICDFRYDGEFSSQTYDFFMECASVHPNDARCMFFRCNANLEKVSLVGAKFIDQETLSKRQLPQNMLMKFVLSTPNLKWFRSDLKPANVEALKSQRPGVAFC